MNETETMFACEIIQQSRFQYLLVIIPFAAVIVFGVLLTVVSKVFGISQRVTGMIVVVAFVVAAGFSIRYVAGSQGSITVTRGALVIAPRLRSVIRLPLPPERAEFKVWYPTSSKTVIRYTMGPVLVLSSGGYTVSIACGDGEIIERIPEAADWGGINLPPSFMIRPQAFADLVKSLDLTWPGPEGTLPSG